MATKVYPAFAAACTVNTTNNSNVLVLNDNNLDSWYEVLGMDYSPEGSPAGYKRPQDAQVPRSQYRYACLASAAADTKEGGRTFEVVAILDATRLQISKRAGATATQVAFYFLKNETMQSALIIPTPGAPNFRNPYEKMKNADGEVPPFQAIDTDTVETQPPVSASAV